MKNLQHSLASVLKHSELKKLKIHENSPGFLTAISYLNFCLDLLFKCLFKLTRIAPLNKLQQVMLECVESNFTALFQHQTGSHT